MQAEDENVEASPMDTEEVLAESAKRRKVNGTSMTEARSNEQASNTVEGNQRRNI